MTIDNSSEELSFELSFWVKVRKCPLKFVIVFILPKRVVICGVIFHVFVARVSFTYLLCHESFLLTS